MKEIKGREGGVNIWCIMVDGSSGYLVAICYTAVLYLRLGKPMAGRRLKVSQSHTEASHYMLALWQ